MFASCSSSSVCATPRSPCASRLVSGALAWPSRVALRPSFGQYPPVAWARPSRLALLFAAVNLLVAGLVGTGVFLGMPVRWWVVDGAAIVVVIALLTSTAALTINRAWCSWALRISAGLLLAIGLALLAAVVLTAAFLHATGGALGARGVLGFALAAALILPYFVVYPAVQLRFESGQRRRQEQP
jgi:hypothetical protein